MREKLSDVDWWRTIHRVSTFARQLRGDLHLESDHRTELQRAIKLTRALEGIARKAVDCQAPALCYCAVCKEMGTGENK